MAIGFAGFFMRVFGTSESRFSRLKLSFMVSRQADGEHQTLKGFNVTHQAFTIEQFISSFKLGRTKVYEEIASGRLTTYKVGKRRFISSQAAAAWQENLEAATNGVKQAAEVAA